MQKLVFLAIFMLPFTYSTCTFDVEDDKRSIITGRIVDSDGNPMPNIGIVSSVSGKRIGSGKSDSNGFYKVVSLESNHDPFIIEINTGDQALEDYTSITVQNMAEGPARSRYLYDLGEQQLHKKSTLNLNIVNTSNQNGLVTYVLMFVDGDCQLRYENDDLLEEYSYCLRNSTYSRAYTFTGTEPAYHREFNSVVSSTAVLTYQINEANQQSVEIPLTEQTQNYEIAF